MYLITHNETYFRYNKIKKIARVLSLKGNFIEDKVASEPEKSETIAISNFIEYQCISFDFL